MKPLTLGDFVQSVVNAKSLFTLLSKRDGLPSHIWDATSLLFSYDSEGAALQQYLNNAASWPVPFRGERRIDYRKSSVALITRGARHLLSMYPAGIIRSQASRPLYSSLP